MTRFSVFDTNVVLAAVRSMSGASRALLTRALLPSDQQILPVISQPLLLEYEDVLKRPENVAVHGLTEDEIVRLIDAFVYSAGRIAAIYFRTRPTLRDPNDELVWKLP